MTIADAPWIQEAENGGWMHFEESPDFEDDTEEQAKEILKADKLADGIADILLGAEETLRKYEEGNDLAREMNDEIREMIDRAEDIGCGIRKLARFLERGVKE